MSIRSFVVVSIFLIISNTGCSSNVPGEMTPTIASPISPSASSVSPMPASSEALPSPSLQSTVVPVDGATSTQVNVRAEPSTAGTVLGIIPANTRIEIIGKAPGGNWLQIFYPHPDAVDGKGWVTAQYISVAETPNVPVIGGPEADSTSGNVAVIQQQLNVRSGPGTDFNSLGTLNPQDVVRLTGKDPNGTWLQVDFPAGPEGKGWISSAFVQRQGTESLPIIAESGLVVGTGTPTSIPATPTPTVVPAREDNDSEDGPLVRMIFDPVGTQTFIYNGDVSAPSGDPEDWLEFISFSRSVRIEAACSGNYPLIELIQNGQVREQIVCGMQQVVSVEPDIDVQIHLSALSASPLSYSSYTVKVSVIP